MKTILKIILVLVVILIAVVLALPLWIGPVAKLCVNKVAPTYTLTAVNLGEFALNPYSGSLRVGDFQLWNPPNYSQKMAVTLGKLSVDVEPASLLTETVHIRDIVVSDVFVCYIGSAAGGFGGASNFEQIRQNVCGTLPSSNEPAAQPVSQPQSTATVKAEPPKKASSRKVIIDHFKLEHLLVQMGPLTVPLPSLELKNIGKKSNGVDWESAWEEIRQRVMQSTGSLTSGAKDLGEKGLQAGKEGLNKALEAVQQGNLDGAKDALKNSGEKLKDIGNSLKGLFR